MADTSIKLYTLIKRENSTAQPSGQGTDVSGILLDETSMLNPKFRFKLASTPNYNYAYISDFGRYYFISDWIAEHGFWIATMHVDVLATYKSTIIAGTHYVLRAASYQTDNPNGDIIDNLYPIRGKTDIIQGANVNSVFDANNICSVLGIINNNQSNKFGAVQYYVMTQAAIGNMMSYLLGSSGNVITDMINYLSGIQDQDIRNSISRSLTNPEQYITESFMLPYVPPVDANPHVVRAGWFQIPTGVTGDVVINGARQFSLGGRITLALPDHPQAATRGNYLNMAPYSNYWLYLGPFGIYPLDSTLVVNSANHSVDINVYGDLMGNVSALIIINDKIIDILHANVKCNFPVGQTTMDVSRAVSSGVSAGANIGAGLATGSPAAWASAGVSIISAAEAIMPKVQTQGNQGTFINVFDDFRSMASCHYVVDEMIGERGRPICKPITLSSLSGFVLCADADVTIGGTDAEAAKINNYLNTGFYID